MRIIKKNGHLSVQNELHEVKKDVHSPNNSINSHNNNHSKNSNKKDSVNPSKKANTTKNFDKIFGKVRGNEEFEMLMRDQGEAILRTKGALMYRNKGKMSDNDLESAINMGLFVAFQKFDPSRGFSFATFFGKVAINEIKQNYRDFKRFNGSYTTQSGYKRVNVSYDVDSEDIISAINLLTSRVDDTDAICEAKDVLALVDELLKELNDDRFTQIIPYVQLEYKTKDIAEELGVRPPQVSKAKKRFATLFFDKYPELKEYIESL
jgi:RNA polymerase sigma factor (sigma-70 family)